MTTRPRALFFAPAFAPVQFSEALVNSKLALAFLDSGWELAVFAADATGSDAYSTQWTDPWGPLREVRMDARRTNESSRIGRVVEMVRNQLIVRHPVSGALWAEDVAQQALRMHQKRPFDLILSRSTSCYAHLPAMLFRRHARVRWVANWNDPPGHRFPAPYHYPLPKVPAYFKDRYLRAAAASADVNSFPSEQLLDYMRAPLGLAHSSRTIVVPHVGLGWRGKSALPARRKFRISHAGNLSAERNPTAFLRALAWLIDTHPDVRIEFEVIGHMHESFNALISDLGLGRAVIRTPGLSFLDCLRKLEDAEALLLLEAQCEEGIFFPSKLVDYGEVGRPVLALSPPGGVAQCLIKLHRFGEFAPANDEIAIRQALEKLLGHCAVAGSEGYDYSAIRDYTSPSRVVELLVQAN